MRSLYIQLIIVVFYLTVSSVLSSNGLGNNWLLGWTLYVSPFVILLMCSQVSSLILIKVYSYVSLFFVLVATLFIVLDQSLYIVPALFWVLLIFSLTALVVTALIKGLKYASSKKPIT